MSNLITFEPAICRPKEVKAPTGKKKTIPARFAGTVSLRAPTYLERQSLRGNAELVEKHMLAAVKAALDDSGKKGGKVDEDALKEEAIKATVATQHERLNRVISRLGEFVVEIKIKRLDDGFTFTKIEELEIDSDMDSVLIEMATKLLSKFQLGKTPSAT